LTTHRSIDRRSETTAAKSYDRKQRQRLADAIECKAAKERDDRELELRGANRGELDALVRFALGARAAAKLKP
jgi:hypothetical protein